MATITGPITTAWGADFTGPVTFTPYPHREARVVSAEVVSGQPITVDFEDGEPQDTLTLSEGLYGVTFRDTVEFIIDVPTGSATYSIAQIVTDGTSIGGVATGLSLPYGGYFWSPSVTGISEEGFPSIAWTRSTRAATGAATVLRLTYSGSTWELRITGETAGWPLTQWVKL